MNNVRKHIENLVASVLQETIEERTNQIFETATKIAQFCRIFWGFVGNPRCCGGLFAPWSGCAYCTDRPPSEGPWRAGHHRAQEGTLSQIKHTTLRRRVSCSHSCARTFLIPSYSCFTHHDLSQIATIIYTRPKQASGTNGKLWFAANMRFSSFNHSGQMGCAEHLNETQW